MLANTSPLGYGANLNLGVSALDPAVRDVLLLNDDAFVTPGAVEDMAAVLRAAHDIGVVGPQIVDETGGSVECTFRFPSIRSELAYQLLLPYGVLRWLRAHWAFAPPSDDIQVVDWVLGAALIVRRAAFNAVGGFDEAFFLYSEETDFAFRLRRFGWRTAFAPRAKVIHLGESSASGQAYGAMLAASRGLYIRRHWSRLRRAAFIAAMTIASAWNGVVVLIACVVRPDSCTKVRARREQLRSSRPNLSAGE